MRLWAVLRRLLPLLAVVGLIFAPLATPVAAAASAVASQISDDMPCCPPEKSSIPDCAKVCPLMAVCLAKCVRGIPVLTLAPLMETAAKRIALPVEARQDGLSWRPISRPPIV